MSQKQFNKKVSLPRERCQKPKRRKSPLVTTRYFFPEGEARFFGQPIKNLLDKKLFEKGTIARALRRAAKVRWTAYVRDVNAYLESQWNLRDNSLIWSVDLGTLYALVPSPDSPFAAIVETAIQGFSNKHSLSYHLREESVEFFTIY